MAKQKILVVDDEPDIVETLKFRLESEGYEVVTAYNGLEALNKARNEKPDLIVLDIMLPKMDGYQVCRLLKFDERYSGIPVLMLTAKTQETDKITGLKTGADEYMMKPFDAKELIRTIGDMVKPKGKT